MSMPKKAVLMVNLGSPDSTSVPDVRRYLREFLGDPRVLDNPAPIRWMVLNLFILPKRPKNSAEAYSRIWTEEGSPLILISERQRQLLEERVDLPVYLAMRYGEPAIADVVSKMKADGVTEFFLMPLYPHYAMSSYETVVVRVMECVRETAPNMKVSLLQPFYNDSAYIAALVESARNRISQGYDKILFSFHGVPERQIRKSDPSHAHCLCSPDCCRNPHPSHAVCYRHQCYETARLFAEHLGIPENDYFVSFQSRLGSDPWLQPFTDHTIERFAREGVKKLLVLTPSFVADCLETLEEIAMEGAKAFEEAGGKKLELIPCLNDHPAFVDWMVDKVEKWRDHGQVI